MFRHLPEWRLRHCCQGIFREGPMSPLGVRRTSERGQGPSSLYWSLIFIRISTTNFYTPLVIVIRRTNYRYLPGPVCSLSFSPPQILPPNCSTVTEVIFCCCRRPIIIEKEIKIYFEWSLTSMVFINLHKPWCNVMMGLLSLESKKN